MVLEERHLAAIMFTDIVGYGVLAQQNEDRALEILETHRKLLRDVFGERGGREVKTTGDGFLLEFASALQAVRSAIEIQEAVTRHNATSSPECRFEIRIGIHVGDIVSRENDVLGDDVNIAARIEPMAEPGGICISEQVYDQVHNKVELHIAQLGKTELKNIASPMEVYKIVLPWQTPASHSGEIEIRKRRHTPIVPGVLVIALVLVSAWFWILLHGQKQTGGSVDSGTATISMEDIVSSPIQRIAVLPLTYLSGEKDKEYFAVGMTEALISELAKISALKVISRTSVMQYKETTKSLPEIAKELGVEAVVEGSVFQSEGQVRITAQLIHAKTDEHLWANTYDGQMADVFSLQSKVAHDIAREIEVTLTEEDQLRLAGSGPVNPEVLEVCMRGGYLLHEVAPKEGAEGLWKAIRTFERAIEIDPNCAPAYAGIARAYGLLSGLGAISPQEGLTRTKEAATRAIEIDDTLAEAHAALAMSYATEWEWEKAARQIERAIELRPNFPVAHQNWAWFSAAQGRFKDAIEAIEKAKELDPFSIDIRSDRGSILFVAGRYEDAAKQFEEILEMDSNWFAASIGLAHCYQMMSRLEEAKSLFQAVLDSGIESPHEIATAAASFARMGDTEKAREILETLLKRNEIEYVPATAIAGIYAGLGEPDQAFEWLEKAYQNREWNLGWLKVDPNYKDLRSDSRFQQLVEKIGMPS